MMMPDRCRILGPRLRVVGLIDVDEARAKSALALKLTSEIQDIRTAWAGCRLFPTVADAALALVEEKIPR